MSAHVIQVFLSILLQVKAIRSDRYVSQIDGDFDSYDSLVCICPVQHVNKHRLPLHVPLTYSWSRSGTNLVNIFPVKQTWFELHL